MDFEGSDVVEPTISWYKQKEKTIKPSLTVFEEGFNVLAMKVFRWVAQNLNK